MSRLPVLVILACFVPPVFAACAQSDSATEDFADAGDVDGGSDGGGDETDASTKRKDAGDDDEDASTGNAFTDAAVPTTVDAATEDAGDGGNVVIIGGSGGTGGTAGSGGAAGSGGDTTTTGGLTICDDQTHAEEAIVTEETGKEFKESVSCDSDYCSLLKSAESVCCYEPNGGNSDSAGVCVEQ